MKSIRLYIWSWIAGLIPESCWYALKNWILRWAGAKIGKNVRIYSSVRILGIGELEIGDDVHIGPEVMIYTNKGARVTIGSHVDIAPRVTILTGGHQIDPAGEHVAGKGTAKDIVIEDGCWIGACSTVLGGVTLRTKTVVAAGSVVTRSVEHGGCLITGMPAAYKKSYL